VKVLDDEQDAMPNSSYSSSSWLCGGYWQLEVHRSKDFVTQLFSLLTAVGSNDLFASTVNVLCNKPVRYPILETVGSAIIGFCKSAKFEKGGPLQMILTCCISQLEIAVRKVIAPPTNSAKPIKFSCSCKDCLELIRFLKHPTESQHRFKIGKGRRRHLHQQLDSSRADVTHTTEHVGNPHTLIVTKNNASYEKDIKKQQQQQALLASLRPLLSVADALSENEPPAKKQKGTGKGLLI